jgi:hypothetical protein
MKMNLDFAYFAPSFNNINVMQMLHEGVVGVNWQRGINPATLGTQIIMDEI